MAEAIEALPKNELVSKLRNVRAGMRRFREERKEQLTRVVDTTATLAGGAIAGAMKGMSEDGEELLIPGTEIPAVPVVSGAFIMLGLAGMAGDEGTNRALTNIGSGMGACVVSDFTAKAVRRARE